MATATGKRRYAIFSGNTIGRDDDSGFCFASSATEALEKAIAWADNSWPDSDGRYEAVVWVKLGDEIVAQQEVEIDASGNRVS